MKYLYSVLCAGVQWIMKTDVILVTVNRWRCCVLYLGYTAGAAAAGGQLYTHPAGASYTSSCCSLASCGAAALDLAAAPVTVWWVLLLTLRLGPSHNISTQTHYIFKVQFLQEFISSNLSKQKKSKWKVNIFLSSSVKHKSEWPGPG